MPGVGGLARKWRGALILTMVMAAMLEAQGQTPLYRQAGAPVEARINDLVRAMLDTGKPVIAILINGRPLAIPLVADRVPAVIEAWYAGQESGTAIGEVLFGDVNPGGKLPLTFPRHSGQLPAPATKSCSCASAIRSAR